ncbi:hypothetical protein J2P12_04355 [Candidatus Bathyarchaeota archaeon]|nr:hypothetical protein [Candidatus Bathyarchaeota archaeon]
MMSKHSSMMDDFRPILPPLIRLLAGVIVLVVIQATVLGFPGISQLIPTTSVTIAQTILFLLGLVVAGIVLKFGTQLAESAGDAWRSLKNWTPLLAYIFQMTALFIVYEVSKPIVSPFFASFPWAYPLLFLLVALGPTIKVVVNTINNLEGKTSTRHVLTN